MRVHLLMLAAVSGSLFGQPSDQAPSVAELPVAAQQGPSCAFFANLPMVAWTTGFDVGTSPDFVRAVYGLRRGDFKYQQSYDKRIFCELFGLAYEETDIKHPPSVEKELLPQAELIVSSKFDNTLDRGNVFSLRVKGLFGGAHNALLLGRDGDRYLVHDPRGGRMLKLSRKELAQMILVKSSGDTRSAKPSFVTNYLMVKVPKSPVARVLPAGEFADELKLEFSDAQRKSLRNALAAQGVIEGEGLGPWIDQYPAVNFAVISDGQGELQTVISKDLKAEQIVGALHLCQLNLNAFQRGTCRLVPVLVLDGKPCALVGYGKDATQPQMTKWQIDDGQSIRVLGTTALLECFKASGALYGTIPMVDEAGGDNQKP